jgi:hypothetical protein
LASSRAGDAFWQGPGAAERTCSGKGSAFEHSATEKIVRGGTRYARASECDAMDLGEVREWFGLGVSVGFWCWWESLMRRSGVCSDEEAVAVVDPT